MPFIYCAIIFLMMCDWHYGKMHSMNTSRIQKWIENQSEFGIHRDSDHISRAGVEDGSTVVICVSDFETLCELTDVLRSSLGEAFQAYVHTMRTGWFFQCLGLTSLMALWWMLSCGSLIIAPWVAFLTGTARDHVLATVSKYFTVTRTVWMGKYNFLHLRNALT